MGRPRLLSRCLTVLAAASLAACGLSEDELLVPSSLEAVYAGGTGGGYGIADMAEGVRGAVSGKVLFTGRPLPQRKPDISSDKLCTGLQPNGIPSEEFLVNADNTLGGAVVYLKKGINKSWATPSESVVLDQVGCQYIPHIAIVQTGQPLVIKSSDPFLHNVRGGEGPNAGFNHAMSQPGELSPKTFGKQEIKRIGCDVHGWMVAYVAIIPHPFCTITGGDGSFKFEGVPPGNYQLAAWHEKLGELTADITLDASGSVTHDFTFERK